MDKEKPREINFAKILEQLQADIKTSNRQDNPKPASDEVQIKAASNPSYIDDLAKDAQYSERNKLYTELLGKYIDDYKKKTDAKAKYKLVFFIATLTCFSGIIIIALIALCNISRKESASLIDLGAVAGSVATMISALVILPKIIASHLFPTNEDENMIGIVQNMQRNDTHIRDYYHDFAINNNGITETEPSKVNHARK